MTYVITQNCCNDASCIAECPVDCIRPTPEERARFASAEMLYIDPDSCIDCGACVDACPVGAVSYEDELTDPQRRFLEFNAGYFAQYPLVPTYDTARIVKLDGSRGELRVAIVGSGPSGAYVAEELLSRGQVKVSVYDALPTPWGLLRSGVAPDHQHTKDLAAIFEKTADKAALELHLNVAIGTDVSVDELLASHHAVVLATGAADAQPWDLPGADLTGVSSANDFVAWFNGHPDASDKVFDLSCERVVIVGNGNVALDVARVLTMSRDELLKTDIADHALEALSNSSVREVVVLGRRGPLQAAYTSPEFYALGFLPGVEVVIDEGEAELDELSRALVDGGDVSYAEQLKAGLAGEYAAKTRTGAERRIVFRYLSEPARVLGADRVEGVEIAHTRLREQDGSLVTERTGESEELVAGLVLTSVGYRGRPIDGVPFDEARGVIPNDDGRVVAAPGLYATGWIRRGAKGGLGSSRVDAEEVVDHLVNDFNAALLSDPSTEAQSVAAIGLDGWRAIDQHERSAGQSVGRPRVKLVTVPDLLEAARG
ncbi:MAG TPA: FAD-dependent oxidoreductase [Nocardioidaceae bacterium]|nr:FAD-dependent oxidoreductase [Nocardioidaceae bacterium]